MARHEFNEEANGGPNGAATPDDKRARLGEQASRASALMASRAAAKRGDEPSAGTRPSVQQKRQGLAQAASAGARKVQAGQAARSSQPAQGQRQASASQTSRAQSQVASPRARPSARTASPQQAYPKNIGEFVRQNIVYIISVVFVIALVTAGIFALRAYLGADTTNGDGTPATYTSPYDWSKLELVDGRYRYVVDGQVKSRTGIDVSSYQEAIDWNAVAADGIDFAYIRVGYRGVTEGGLYLDDWYWENIEGAKAAGIDCGAYFFSQAISVEEAIEEADFTLSYLEGISLECPIVFDAEIYLPKTGTARSIHLSNDEMTAIAQAFCERVEAAGYQAMIYGNAGDLGRYNSDLLARYPVWWAEYDHSHPSETMDIVMWQYGNQGSVAGINTNVDMSVDVSGVL